MRRHTFSPRLVTLEDRLTPAVELVSVTPDGTSSGDAASGDISAVQELPHISDDGRFVVFTSLASNLTATPTAKQPHIYWRDTLTGVTKLASRGTNPNNNGEAASISADGRFVTFEQAGTNLWDSSTDTITKIVAPVVTPGTRNGPSTVSPDGRYVAFRAEDAFVSVSRVYLFDRTTGNTIPISAPTDDLANPLRFSADSKTLVYDSVALANVLVPGVTDANEDVDAFAYDIATGKTTLLSVNAAGTGTAERGTRVDSINGDGTRVTLVSNAAELDPTAPRNPFRDNVFLRDRTAGTTKMISTTPDRTRTAGGRSVISRDGKFVLFESDGNLLDAGGGVFRYEVSSGKLELVDVRPDGTATPFGARNSLRGISADGRFITLQSEATDLVPGFTPATRPNASNINVFVRDMIADVTILVSHTPGKSTQAADDASFLPAISADGKVVVFNSTAINLTALADGNARARDLFRSVLSFPPTVTAGADVSVTAGTAIAPVAVTVADTETAAGSLAVTAKSSNATLLPAAGIVVGGSGANRTVTVSPAVGQTGTATVTVTVTDADGQTDTDTFTVTVTPPNAAPTISNVADRTTVEGRSTGSIAFTVGDAETAAGSLVVVGGSNDTVLVPVANIVLGGTGANRTVTVTPVNGQTGTATITLTVTDAGGKSATETFTLQVDEAPPTELVGFPQFAAGTDTGGNGSVVFYNPDKSIRATVQPFGAFTGGVRTAAADFNSDGIADIIAGTGPGRATRVVVMDGATQKQLFAVDPFEATFTGGVYVAAGDVNGDGVPDLAITPDEGGGPRVDMYGGNGFGKIVSFFGIDDTNFRGGARASVADMNGDGVGDLVVVAGFGGGPRVAAFDGTTLSKTPEKLFGDFFAFEQTLRNGIFVTAGDINGDGFADLIAGGGPGGGPRVLVFDGKNLLNNQYVNLANFFGGDPDSRGGIRLAVKDIDGDNRADLVVGSGSGAGSRVTAYLGKNIVAAGTPPSALDFDSFAGFSGGVFVG
jgi:Tol biopolymer transport system component